MVCVALPYDTVYNGTDGVIEYVLLNSDKPVADLSAITRIVFLIGSVTIDSNVVGSAIINWNKQTTYYGETVDIVSCVFGGMGLSVGEYSGSRMTVYDPANPNGIVWSDSLNIQVKA